MGRRWVLRTYQHRYAALSTSCVSVLVVILGSMVSLLQALVPRVSVFVHVLVNFQPLCIDHRSLGGRTAATAHTARALTQAALQLRERTARFSASSLERSDAVNRSHGLLTVPLTASCAATNPKRRRINLGRAVVIPPQLTNSQIRPQLAAIKLNLNRKCDYVHTV